MVVPLTLLVACAAARLPTPNLGIAEPQAVEAPIAEAPDEESDAGMAKVEGDYCPDVEETCIEWSDDRGHVIRGARSASAGRCDAFAAPTRCLSARVHKSFRIDRYEFPDIEGARPQSWMTWYDAKQACESRGKRLCTGSEWTMACEGPDMQPYPYGDGYHRSTSACNTDNQVPRDVSRRPNPTTGLLPPIDIFSAKRHDSPASALLDELLVPSGAMGGCVSPYGVHDMVGNIDEFVVNEAGKPYPSGLKGGHVFGPAAVRHACRPMTDAHGPGFSWYETGSRCCVSE
jgi:hypothetical protein